MYERYCALRDIKGYKDSDIAKGTGIVSSTFSDWKKGKSAPNSEKLLKIARFLEVSMEYLMTGEKPEIPGFEPEHLELIDLYSKLKEEQKTAVLNLLRSFAL